LSRSGATRRAAIFLALYTLGIFYLSLYPFHFAPRPGFPLFLWSALDARRQIFDFLVNVLFYIPLGGALLAALGGRLRALPAAIFVGAAISVIIESIQYWTPGRYTTLNDLAANTAGTAIGACAAALLYRRVIAHWLESHFRSERWRLSAVQGLFVLEWLLWQDFPFFPVFSLPKLSQTLNALLHPDWDWVSTSETAVGFATLAVVLGSTRWMWVALAALPLQTIVMDRNFVLPTLLAAIVGWGTGRIFRKENSGLMLGCCMMVWLALEEFRPFHPGLTAQPFAWMPFQGAASLNTTTFYSTIFKKLFLYTAGVWSIWRYWDLRDRSIRRLRWTLAVGVPALILGLGEWAQQYLEGRTPESTDLVLLFAGAAFLAAASGIQIGSD